MSANNLNYQQFGPEFMSLMDSLPNPSEPTSRDTYINLLRQNVIKAKAMDGQGNRIYIKFLEYMDMMVSSSSI